MIIDTICMAEPVGKSVPEDTDGLEWNPEWDEDKDEGDVEEEMMMKDAASSQFADLDLMAGDDKFFVNLTTTSNLMSLKGSLASILSASANTELYAALIRKLEQAVPEEDREDFAALMIQRNYRRISQQRKARAERERRRFESVQNLQSVYICIYIYMYAYIYDVYMYTYSCLYVYTEICR